METTILGLSFNTRIQGLAVFKSNLLVDYSVKHYIGSWSPSKRDSILSSLVSCIEHYTISVMVLSIPDEHCQTPVFHDLLEAIKMLAYLNGIPVTEYPLTEIYLHLGSPVRRTRLSLIKRMTLFYPELQQYYEKELRNKYKYYIKMFESVAVASWYWIENNK